MTTTSIDNRGWVNARTRQRLAIFLITALAFLALYAGWRLFWFLTDDAYIAFRYASNSQLGYGYTWNLPPFRPVEGYTSYLWVLLLDIIWRLTDQPPPAIANNITFLFACGTLALTLIMLRRQTRHTSLWLLILALVGILSNRTFLAWTSSGLETAMFNFWVLAWIFVTLKVNVDKWHWAIPSAIAASFAALTRPDGLLLIAATLLLQSLLLLNAYRSQRWHWQRLALFLPFLPNALHFLWRKAKYGEWLPNTHAAKVTAVWPESGLRYLLSFILEYGLWLWLLLLVIVAVLSLSQRQRLLTEIRRWWPQPLNSHAFIPILIIATLTAHFAYYTIIVGGDHFEYRIYSHLIPLIFVSALWLLNHLSIRPVWQLIWLGGMIIVASPIPWVHWNQTQSLTTREQTFGMMVEISPHFPTPLQPYVSLFDTQQQWLISRGVGARHQEHKIFLEHFANIFPSREEGFLLDTRSPLVFVGGSIGIPGWVLPTANIIDTNGLTDYVIARNPATFPDKVRVMAHERYPPRGYVECFQPNLTIVAGKVILHNRELTDEAIRECESTSWPPVSDEETAEFSAPILPPLDHFLWHSWPELPLYLSLNEPQQVEQTLTEFIDHRSITGCAALTNLGQTADPPHWFILLNNSPDQSGLPPFQTLSWYQQLITDQWAENTLPHNAAWVAPNLNNYLPQPTITTNHHWSDNIRLVGYDLAASVIKAGETADLTFQLNLPQGFNPTYSFFVNLADQSGHVIAQYNGNPCSPLLPPELITPDTTLLGKTHLNIPPETPPGDYTIAMGLINWQSGQPVPTEEAGQSEIHIGTIQVND